jgi:hypothetical protein
VNELYEYKDAKENTELSYSSKLSMESNDSYDSVAARRSPITCPMNTVTLKTFVTFFTKKKTGCLWSLLSFQKKVLEI